MKQLVLRLIFNFFQRHAMYLTDKSEEANVEYHLVINGPKISSIINNRWTSVRQRENKGYDFGAWCSWLDRIDRNNYDFFIFINNSLRGPFDDKIWPITFTNLLNDYTKLSGVTIACGGLDEHSNPHNIKPPVLQSMMCCMDRIGLELADKCIFSQVRTKDMTFMETVLKCEEGLSYAMLTAGYSISCILKPYQVDYRDKTKWIINPNIHLGNCWMPQSYFGKDLEPRECIFFKSNRNVNPDALEKETNKQNQLKYY